MPPSRLQPITFGLGSAELTDAGKAEIDKVVAFLATQTPGNIEIGGHTDSDGEASLNPDIEPGPGQCGQGRT